MGKNKPSWAKTNVSWEIRKLILQHWAKGQTINQTVTFFQLNSDSYKDAPVDRNTISKVLKELDSMPIALLQLLIKELPEVTQSVLERRPELETEISEKPTSAHLR